MRAALLSLGSSAVAAETNDVAAIIANARPAKLFISYSHEDERHMKRLATHLAGLRREGLIADWHDRKIPAGDEWHKAIDDRLKTADCVLLLVSPDFLASDFCYSIEMECALKKYQEGRNLVIPVIVQPADWRHTRLRDLQALPKDGKPVVEWAIRDRAWLNVVEGLRLALDRSRLTNDLTLPKAANWILPRTPKSEFHIQMTGCGNREIVFPAKPFR
jgi:hypothetical protein